MGRWGLKFGRYKVMLCAQKKSEGEEMQQSIFRVILVVFLVFYSLSMPLLADDESVETVQTSVEPETSKAELGEVTAESFEAADGFSTEVMNSLLESKDYVTLLEKLEWKTNQEYSGWGSPEAVTGGTLKFVSSSYPPTLRCFGLNSNSVFNSMLESLCYETLLAMDQVTFDYVPNLAKRWAIGPDLMTFFFEIDPEAKWSDGFPVTSKDVLATYKIYVDPEIDDPFTNDFWRKYEPPVAINDRVVMFRSGELNWRAFLSAALSFYVYPAHVLDKLTGREFLEEYQNKMMPGSGPYSYESAKVNEEIVLIRRNNWWQRNHERQRGVYNFDRLQFIFISDENLIKERFKRGDVDWLVVNVAREWHREFIPAALPPLARGWMQRRKVYTHQPAGVSGIAFNTRTEPFDDIRVRRAFAHLYNREKMMDRLFFNEYEYTDSFYPNSPYENPANPKIRFDPDRAVELLEEAGWLQRNRDRNGWLVKDGKRFVLSLNYTSPSSERILTILQEELRDVGIELHLKQVTWATDIKEVGEHNFQISMRAYGGLLFPNPESSFHSKFADLKNNNNIWGFKNARVDEICAEYPMMFDPAERVKAVREVDGIVSSEHLFAFGWNSPSTRVVYWNKFGMPDYVFSKWGDERSILSLWWFCPEKEQKLKEAMKNKTMLPVGTEVIKWWDENHPREE